MELLDRCAYPEYGLSIEYKSHILSVEEYAKKEREKNSKSIKNLGEVSYESVLENFGVYNIQEQYAFEDVQLALENSVSTNLWFTTDFFTKTRSSTSFYIHYCEQTNFQNDILSPSTFILKFLDAVLDVRDEDKSLLIASSSLAQYQRSGCLFFPYESLDLRRKVLAGLICPMDELKNNALKLKQNFLSKKTSDSSFY